MFVYEIILYNLFHKIRPVQFPIKRQNAQKKASRTLRRTKNGGAPKPYVPATRRRGLPPDLYSGGREAPAAPLVSPELPGFVLLSIHFSFSWKLMRANFRVL